MAKKHVAGLFGVLLSNLVAAQLWGHELWFECPARVIVGNQVPVVLCFGHAGERSGGEMLAQNLSRLSAWVRCPAGERQNLGLELAADCYRARLQAVATGLYWLSGELQVGIIERQMHSIPAKTRIIMTAKAGIQAGDGSFSWSEPVGHTLEIVPLTPLAVLRPGGAVRVKVLFQGQPIGGPNVTVHLGTLGPQQADLEVTEREWSIEAPADPRSGEVSFPLIAPGLHVAVVRYTDDQPGTYDGELEFETAFSHLKRGDAFERTLHMATLSFQVQP